MPEPLEPALTSLRELILDDPKLIRALASGRRKGARPRWRRVEMRYVDLKAGRRLQVTSYDETQAHVTNHEDPAAAIDELFAEPFGNWHLETTTETVQLRVTKSGEAVLSRTEESNEPPDRDHDRTKQRLLPENDPALIALGISDAQGRVRPSRRAKYRQIEEFVRLLATAVDDAILTGKLAPSADNPLRVVDLGCGNAYLTFAAHSWLTRVRGLPARLIGVDVKEQSRRHNAEIAEGLGLGSEIEFVVAEIAEVELERPDVALALHACDTATDDALARAVRWETPLILAAPCCHRDISAQLRKGVSPTPYGLLTRDGILRERFADTLTDALRAAILRRDGYRVEVVEFVGSEHTPRNTLLRAVRTEAAGSGSEPADLAAAWGVQPRLAALLDRT